MLSTLNFKHVDQNKNGLLLKKSRLIFPSQKLRCHNSKVENVLYVEKYSDNIVLIMTVSEVSRMNRTFSGRIREHVMDDCQFVNH